MLSLSWVTGQAGLTLRYLPLVGLMTDLAQTGTVRSL